MRDRRIERSRDLGADERTAERTAAGSQLAIESYAIEGEEATDREVDESAETTAFEAFESVETVEQISSIDASDPHARRTATHSVDIYARSYERRTVRRPSAAPGRGSPGSRAIVEDRPPDIMDPVERDLIAAIANSEEASRLRYADWLEARGEHARASFLRIEHALARLSPGAPRFEELAVQLRAVARRIDLAWRASISRPQLEGCPTRDASCPRDWLALVPTERADARFCTTCRRSVYYFATVDQAREHARAGHRVAIEAGAERWEGDLVDIGRACPGCHRRVPSQARFCPHCGAASDLGGPARYR
ncbi:MAG: TIGR02996 domain-containing protein [Kofleriaceae bacterium]